MPSQPTIEVIFFHALDKENIGEIVVLQADQVAERLLRQRGIKLSLTERAKKFLVDKGFDPKFGARPLKRVIQNQILDPLAMKIITGEVPEESLVSIDFVKDEVRIKVK